MVDKHSFSYCFSLMSLSLTRGSTELLLWFVFLSSQGDSEALFPCTSKTQWVTVKAQWTPFGLLTNRSIDIKVLPIP